LGIWLLRSKHSSGIGVGYTLLLLKLDRMFAQVPNHIFWPVKEFCVWTIVGVYDQEIFFASPQQAVYCDFSLLNANDGTGARICNFVFCASAITEYDDNLVFIIRSNEGLQSRDPICERIHVGFVGHPTEVSAILSGHPRHGDNDQIGLYLENMEGELECMPWGFEFVRAGTKLINPASNKGLC
jgi:hypothetical protein